MAASSNDPARTPDVRGDGPTVGLFESVYRHALAMGIVVMLAAACGYLVSSRQPATYQAATVLLFPDGTGSFDDQGALPSQDRGRYLATQADLVTSGQVAEAAAGELGDGTPGWAVVPALSAVPGELSNTMTITATAADAARAARLADAGAAGYLAVLRDQARTSAAAAALVLQRQYDDIQDRIDSLARRPSPAGTIETRSALRERLSELAVEQSRMRAVAEGYQPAVRVLRPAATPTRPISPTPLRDGGLAALIALLGGAVVAWGFEARSQRGPDAGRLPRLLGTQRLGCVPHMAGGDAAGLDAAELASHERWQQAVSAIDASLREIGGRCLLVTSTVALDDGVRSAVGLAVSAAADGRSVVVVDADHARRELSTLTGAAAIPGLTELVERTGYLRREGHGADHREAAAGAGQASGASQALGGKRNTTLDLLAAGRAVPNPAAFHRSAPFRATLASLRQCADLVLVVGPPVLAGADASVLADSTDAVLLVVPASATDDELREARTRLSWSLTGLLGYLLIEPARRPARLGWHGRLARLRWRRRPPGPRDAEPGAPGDAGPAPLAGLLKPLLVVPRGVARPNGRLPTTTYLAPPPIEADTGP